MMFSEIMYVCSISCMVYYFIIASYPGMRSRFHRLWIFIAAFFVGIGSLHLLNVRGAINIPGCICAAFWIAATVVVLILTVTIYKIAGYGTGYPDADAKYMIVLGAEVKDSKISNILRNRLESAYEYYEKNPKVILIVSGANGTDGNLSEADAMERYLTEKGVPDSQILKENRACNTIENIRFSAELADIRDEKVILVTNRFHCYRTACIAEKQGMQNFQCLGAGETPIMIPTYYLRETLAVLYYRLSGRI